MGYAQSTLKNMSDAIDKDRRWFWVTRNNASRWAALVCLLLRHRWHPDIPLKMFQWRTRGHFEFRRCLRCGRVQLRPRKSEQFG